MTQVLRQIQDEELGVINFYRSRGRRVAVKVHPVKGIWVGLPPAYPMFLAMLFLDSKREWIKKNMAAPMDDKIYLDAENTEKSYEAAGRYLPARLKELADEFGMEYNKVSIKRLKSKWGSCSNKGNINLSSYLISLPSQLQDYVMLHELAHLEYLNHSPEYHSLLEGFCEKHFGISEKSGKALYPITRSMEKDLKRYIVG